jgi:tetratricopeptide (TPR) repeat protein
MLFLAIVYTINAQPNCHAFLYRGDTLKYEACVISQGIEGHYQFSREFQKVLDKAISIDPSFDYAYREKSVAYLKSGDFLTWKKLMDKAVNANPIENLGYRGWCRYQFFRDYDGAIEDIERLDALTSYDIGTSANGDYHLHIARAICYKALGKYSKAIEIIETQLSKEEYFIGKYDYLHLGVLYFETGEYEKALNALAMQEKKNDLAENQYTLS